MNLSGMEALFISFCLVLGRISGVMLSLPMFGFEVAPMRMRIIFAAVLTLTMMGIQPVGPVPDSLGMALTQELFLGLLIGMTVRVALAAIEVAGELCGVQMGFGFQKTVNPLSKEQNGPVTNIWFAIAGVMFFATGAHHHVIRGLATSFRAFPPGHVSFRGDFSSLVVDAGSTMMEAGVRLALPLMLVAIITQLCFGVLTRVAPQLNVWALGFAFMIGVGFVALLLFMPSIVKEIELLLSVGLEEMLFRAVNP